MMCTEINIQNGCLLGTSIKLEEKRDSKTKKNVRREREKRSESEKD